MQINIKKLHPDAVIPQYAYPGDAGMDLYAVSREEYPLYIEYRTGLAFEIPVGYFGLLVPRSSVSNKSLLLSNSAGILDSNFRGELTFRYRHHHFHSIFNGNISDHYQLYHIGDKIGQIVILPFPLIEFVEVDELSETKRGANGYGSSGH